LAFCLVSRCTLRPALAPPSFPTRRSSDLAYSLQDSGLDTVDANLEQGLPEDAREYSVAGQILRDLGIKSANLLTNNPHKGSGLRGFGVDASAHTPIEIEPNADNIDYLRTKRDRMDHDLPQVARWDAAHAEN